MSSVRSVGLQIEIPVLCRHHQTYVRKLKEALRKAPELMEKDLNQLMQSVGTVSIWHPEVDQDVRNHGGGKPHLLVGLR